jgi:hypothetical protein
VSRATESREKRHPFYARVAVVEAFGGARERALTEGSEALERVTLQLSGDSFLGLTPFRHRRLRRQPAERLVADAVVPTRPAALGGRRTPVYPSSCSRVVRWRVVVLSRCRGVASAFAHFEQTARHRRCVNRRPSRNVIRVQSTIHRIRVP